MYGGNVKLNMCLAKIHRATVTGADLDYEGSITIDKKLLWAAGLLPNQMVQINNLANGEPWRTYIVPGETGKGEIILNGPPAHHAFKKGDLVVIWADVWVDEYDAWRMENPRVVFVDEKNQVVKVKPGWRP